MVPEAPGERLRDLRDSSHVGRPARQDQGQLHERQAVCQVPQRARRTNQLGGPVGAGKGASRLRPGPVMHRAAEKGDAKQTTVTELLSSGDRELNHFLRTLEVASEAEQAAAHRKELHSVGAGCIPDGREASHHDGLTLGEPPGIEELQGQVRAQVSDRPHIAEHRVLIQGLTE